MPEPSTEQRKLIEEIRQLNALTEERIERALYTIRETQEFIAKQRARKKRAAQNQEK